MDLLPLLATGQRIEDLITTVETVPAGASSDEVNACFRSDASVPAALIHRSGGRLGLISRLPFQAALTGRLGFGGALYGRRRAAVLARRVRTDFSGVDLRGADSAGAGLRLQASSRDSGTIPELLDESKVFAGAVSG